jgi:hypothetical protein
MAPADVAPKALVPGPTASTMVRTMPAESNLGITARLASPAPGSFNMVTVLPLEVIEVL